MTLAVNQFADMTDAEYRRMVPKFKKPANYTVYEIHPKPQNIASLPSALDWRAKGAVTDVKDQASCGSCWSFGAIGSLEGVSYLATKKLVRMSEQQLVDCSRGQKYADNQGCDGGFSDGGFQWIIDNQGVSTEAEYKYLGQNGYCDPSKKSSGIKLSKFVDVSSGSEAALQDAISHVGPVAVAIDASQPTFRFYASGVYDEPNCKNDVSDLDHSVLAVGYGTENGSDYWIVKNSWSTHWGDAGYIKMSRNKGNQCGIASQASYPVLAQ